MNKSLWMGFASFALVACVSPVTTDFETGHNFSTYQTFAWVGDDPVAESGDTDISPRGEQAMMEAAESVLSGKGFTRIESADDADFLVGFTVGARDKVDFRTSYDRVFIPDSFGNFRSVGIQSVDANEYTQGSLAIDIFDGNSGRAVWNGTGSRRLSNAELRGTTARIYDGVAAVLEDFPPTLADE